MAAKNAMEIYTLLDKSNCKKCGEKTCLAFAGAAFLGNRKLQDCPILSENDINELSSSEVDSKQVEDIQDTYLKELLGGIMGLDFRSVAKRTGAHLTGQVLTVRVLGKNFGIRPDGTFETDLHIIPWVVAPLLEYLMHCSGKVVSGEWISFREISGGMEKYGLFKKRGEDVLRNLADQYPDFFDDIVHMFHGEQVKKRFESDVSVVLYPLPLVPMMICYWKADEGMGSSLNLFFDQSINENLGLDAAFFLGTGLAQMFEKLAEHHGF